MAYKLVEEVLDHAPAMSPAERLVLVAIAELAREGTRARDIEQSVLLRRACVEERGLRHALSRLAEKGLEVRVPIKMDKNGKPIYAVPGRTGTFCLPHFTTAPKGCDCYRCRKEDSRVPEHTLEDFTVRQADSQVLLGGLHSPSGGLQGPPIPSGETEGLSPDRSENRVRRRPEPGPHPRADLISSMRLNALDASRKTRAKANGTHPPPFEALMKYQLNPDKQGNHAQEPGL